MSDKQDVKVTGTPEPRRRLGKRQLIAIAIVGLVLVLGGSGWYAVGQYQAHKEAQQAKLLKQDDQRFEEAVQLSNKYRGQRQNGRAIDAIKAYADSAVKKENKVSATVRMATIYEVKRDKKNALATYQQAERLNGKANLSIATGIARTSYALGDKKNALKYYKDCLLILQQSKDPNVTSDAAQLKRTISAIEGQL